MKMTKVALIGVGDISGIYLENLTQLFKQIEIIGVCDLVREKAERAAEKYHVDKIYESMADVFADPEVEIVLNLTRPYEHFEVTKQALVANKHVYSEKPLAATKEEGEILVSLAKEKGLMIGGAPDTFLGASIQTCRKLIEDDFIGEIVGCNAAMICRGHETWHPDPAFYYQFGGGPMMDMGPYYLTAMVNLMGRVTGVTSVTRKSFASRMITSQPQARTEINVEVPTYVTGILEFENGAIGNLLTTFDVVYQEQARFEIYGSKGTLIVPDPNFFGEKVYLLRKGADDFKEMPLMFDYQENSRGLGLAEMAVALQNGRHPRANMEQTFHVLDIMTAFQRSSDKKGYEKIESPYMKEQPMESAMILGIIEN
ncbi:Gfo/Idh/MocA family protein [Enterococcus eurekensis]|uniref:Gfo/Idh/MocA family protein n=2 Tax=Enterococcus TaxID=1350 RepID=A0ABV9M201_9ENTE|nr:Gfo/Idh/MocA family oxidoreductase [Candidatus Enterococcus avicola]